MEGRAHIWNRQKYGSFDTHLYLFQEKKCLSLHIDICYVSENALCVGLFQKHCSERPLLFLIGKQIQQRKITTVLLAAMPRSILDTPGTKLKIYVCKSNFSILIFFNILYSSLLSLDTKVSCTFSWCFS
jgi:hypothetical protein